MHTVEEAHMDHAHEISPEREGEIINLWNRQQESYNQLNRLSEESAEVVYSPEKLAEAFAMEPETVACVDERVMASDTQKPKIAIAGSGILLSEEEFVLFVENIKASKTKNITFHGEEDAPCGACAAFCAAQGGGDPKKAGTAAAQRLIDSAGLGGEPIWAPYDEGSDKGIHDARAIVIDGSGRFNPAVLDFPKAFQSSVRYFGESDNYMNKELDVIMGIALGHGFGKWFEAESAGDKGSDPVKHQPLLIVLVGDPSQSQWTVEALQQRLQPTLAKYGHVAQVVSLSMPSAG
jgi:hypothetical protein